MIQGKKEFAKNSFFLAISLQYAPQAISKKFPRGKGNLLANYLWKPEFLTQILALWEGHFDHFQGQKTCFLDFLKVGVELFRSSFGIVFGLKMCTFSSFLARKVDILPLKSKVYVKFWPAERVILTIFRVKKPASSVYMSISYRQSFVYIVKPIYRQVCIYRYRHLYKQCI